MTTITHDFTDEPYRPSNGSEGMDFMAHFCDRCTKDAAFRAGTGDSCPIAAATLAFQIGDPEYPKEWVQTDGVACCTAFVREAA